MTAASGVVPVLVAAAGQPWEAAALELLGGRGAGTTVARRCVDLHDLLAAGRTGAAGVAVVAGQLDGLDLDSVDLLVRSGVGVVLVAADGPAAGLAARAARADAVRVVDAGLGDLVASVRAVAGRLSGAADDDGRRQGAEAADAGTPDRGRTVVVWGPAGAPGRTTVATGLAAELASRSSTTFLLDADPYGGAVAQHLGILDEVSGLLAAARAANAGRLDAGALAGMARAVGPRLRVLTGLPRPDRWREVRPAAFADLLDTAAGLAEVLVADTGFSLEEGDGDPFGAGPRRNTMTLDLLERADELVVVGSADPVGLARLARGLVELAGTVGRRRMLVVVNRARPSLGWSEGQVRGMVEGFAPAARVCFLPDDRQAADQALMAGRSVVEVGDSPLRRGIADLADALGGSALGGSARGGPGPRRRRLRSRTAGRGR